MKSIFRSLMNEVLKPVLEDMNGQVLDLASGSAPSYSRYLARPAVTIVRADRDASDVQRIDFDKPFPYRDNEFDAALCVNALYIAIDPTATLKELYRVLKKGGRLAIVTPFIFAETREPHDFIRWTSEGLEKLVKGVGFDEVKIIPIGGYFTASLYLIEPFLLFDGLRWAAQNCARLLDRLVPHSYFLKRPCPIGHLVSAIK